MPGWWLASGDQRRLTGSGSALEALCDDVRYKTMHAVYFFTDPDPVCDVSITKYIIIIIIITTLLYCSHKTIITINCRCTQPTDKFTVDTSFTDEFT